MTRTTLDSLDLALGVLGFGALRNHGLVYANNLSLVQKGGELANCA